MTDRADRLLRKVQPLCNWLNGLAKRSTASKLKTVTEFKPTSEAVEAVAKAISPRGKSPWAQKEARVAIATFVEAEGLRLEICTDHNKTAAWVTPIGDAQRLVGPWRKRD